MGGHGALTLYLLSLSSASPYLSASAFAPITNPTLAPWGEKAFTGYLTGGVEEGKAWDAVELLKKTEGKVNILVDVVSLARRLLLLLGFELTSHREPATTSTSKSSVRFPSLCSRKPPDDPNLASPARKL